MKTLIIIDMQNDFVTGNLANTRAQEIVPKICSFIKKFKGHIILTRDTHYPDYYETQEGKKLPFAHCIDHSWGWEIVNEIKEAVKERCPDYINKETFGSLDIKSAIPYLPEEIILVGTCTDICVVSNALILKAQYPDVPVIVISDLCAGTNIDNEEAALQTMRMCQCECISELGYETTYQAFKNDSQS